MAVSSGTAGLHLCLCAMRIGPGDEVIVPSFTFVAAANVIRYVGAHPIFVDIDPVTLNLNPAAVADAITPRTRAIMIVHTFGVAAEMDALLQTARRHNLLVLEDACESLGAEYKGERVGSFGDAAVFAFYPNKQITTGEGGMVVTRDPHLAREIRALRNQGRYETDDWHQHSVLGYNYRLSEVNAALGCAQMQRLDAILRRRESVATLYEERLGGRSGLSTPPLDLRDRRISWFVYVVHLTGTWNQGDRDGIVAELGRNGVRCGRYFAPIHTQPAYRSVQVRHPLPATEHISQHTIALPFFTTMTTEQVNAVCTVLLAAIAAPTL